MVTFFSYFECDFHGLSVRVLFEDALPFLHELYVLCSVVAEEHGLSGPRSLQLVSPSLCLPLAVFGAERPGIWKFVHSYSFHKPNVSSVLWSG